MNSISYSAESVDKLFARFIFTELALSMTSCLTGIFSVVNFGVSNSKLDNQATFTYWGGPHKDSESLIDYNHYMVDITGLNDGSHSKVERMDINNIFIGIP